MPSAKPSSRRGGGPSTSGTGTSAEKLPSKRDLPELQLQHHPTTTRNPFQKFQFAAESGEGGENLFQRARTRSGAEFGQVFPEKKTGLGREGAGSDFT